jgi:hypothetical protein
MACQSKTVSPSKSGSYPKSHKPFLKFGWRGNRRRCPSSDLISKSRGSRPTRLFLAQAKANVELLNGIAKELMEFEEYIIDCGGKFEYEI